MGIYRKLKTWCFSFCLLPMPIFAVSIMLDNDSNFPLNAQIIDALGRHLALIPLHPGQTYIYDVPEGAFDPNTNQPYTPLTVIFLCKGSRPYDYSKKQKKPNKNDIPNNSEYVDQFGIWTGVPRGAYVNALGSPSGSKSCITKENPKAKKNPITKSRTINYGANNWSNDGGITWTNDASSGEGSCREEGRTCSGQVNPQKKKSTQNSNDDFNNDGGDEWSNDQEKSTKQKEKKKDPAHSPSSRTPMPFVERN